MTAYCINETTIITLPRILLGLLETKRGTLSLYNGLVLYIIYSNKCDTRCHNPKIQIIVCNSILLALPPVYNYKYNSSASYDTDCAENLNRTIRFVVWNFYR